MDALFALSDCVWLGSLFLIFVLNILVNTLILKGSKGAPYTADIHHSEEFSFFLTVLNVDFLEVLLQAASKISVQCCPLVVPSVSVLSFTQMTRGKNILEREVVR